MKLIKNIWTELLSLLVDDGFLAIAALVAIGVTYLLTRDGAIGPSNTAGWGLFLLLAVSVVVSVRRGVRSFLAQQ